MKTTRYMMTSLSDLCEISTGKYDANHGSQGGPYPFFTCADKPICSPTYSFEGDAIIVPGNGANVGLVLKYTGKFEAYQRTYVLHNFKCDANYLFHHMQGNWRRANKFSQYGSATNYIRMQNFHDYQVPVPPLPEQRRIAAILDKADSIRRKRQETIHLTESLLRATFLDMFGDPVTNPKGWPVKPLEELGTLDRGKSKHRPRNDPALLGGIHPLIQTAEVANSGGEIRSFSQTYSDLGLKQSQMWPAGTLCITIAANIAKTGVLRFPACFPDSVVGFTPSDQVTTEYIQFLFSFLQPLLEANAPQVAQKNINLRILREIAVPVPTMAMQRRFEKITTSSRDIRFGADRHTEKLSELFHALQQYVFLGKL